MAKTPLPPVDHKGQRIEPKNGVYRCPNDCGSKGYPKPKWKTKTGFEKHLVTCDAAIERSKIREQKKKEADELKKQVNDFNKKAMKWYIKHHDTKYHVGDLIYYVHKQVTKPTHEQRGNRMVKVRYEEERRYSCAAFKIAIVTAKYSGKDVYEDDNENIYIVYSNTHTTLFEREIFTDKTECETRAQDSQKSYDDGVKFSQYCR